MIQPGLTIQYWKGESVFVSDTPKGTFVEFNPTKYMTGQNFTMINRVELKTCIDQFSDEFQTDFTLWQVSSFDFNINVSTAHPPKFYMCCFGGLKNWNVTEYKHAGKTYKTASNSKALTIYDKALEMKKREEVTPNLNDHQHSMRIELSINKQPKNIKNLKDMTTISDYAERDNYVKLPVLLLETYHQIEKNELLDVIPGLSKNDHNLLTALKTYSISGYKEKIKIEYPANFRYHWKKVDALVERVIQHRQTQGYITDLQRLNDDVNNTVQQMIQCT